MGSRERGADDVGGDEGRQSAEQRSVRAEFNHEERAVMLEFDVVV
ncbi:hypothetical protein WMF27_23335 [Sorangium sp. So ce281]